MKSRKAFSEKGRAVFLLVFLAVLFLIPVTNSTTKILLGSNTRSGPEVIFLDSCAQNSACTENTTLGIEISLPVYGIQVADLDSDGLNDTSIMAAVSAAVGQYEVRTYNCDALGCFLVPEKTFDLPYGGAVSGDKMDFGNVDNSEDGSYEWIIGQPIASTAIDRPELRIFRCGTNETGWFGLNLSNNGTSYNFRGASFVNQDLAFVVGDGGIGYRWDGGVWQRELLSTTNNTLDVDCAKSGENFCMAGGVFGFMAYWNGTPNVWTKVLRPGATQVNRIFVLNSTLAFAAVNTVAATTNIWIWNGTQWSTQTTPNATFYTVSMINSTYGWAGGSGGNLAFWNGATWSTATSPTTATINSIDIWNASFAFAGTSTGQLLRWDGSSWAVDTIPASTAISRVRFFNGSYAKAILGSPTLDSYVWTGGGTGTWARDPTTMPRYGTWTDLAVYYPPTGPTIALAQGITGISAKYGNDTKKCFETDMSVNYYTGILNLKIADINDDGANELVATGTSASTTANYNEFQVWNCTGGVCKPTYSTNHDSRQPIGALYVGDIDGDGATEIVKGMAVATTASAGSCAANELCVVRCSGMICLNCGAGCMINTGLRTLSATYGTGIDVDQPTQGRLVIGVDHSTAAGNDIMVYKMGVANGGSANTLTLQTHGLNIGTGTGTGQAVAYETDALDYYGYDRDQILAPWAWTGNHTFTISECSGTSACNASSWFSAGVAAYVQKFRNAVDDSPYFITGPSDSGSDHSSPTTAGTNVTFTGTAKTKKGNSWNLVVCGNPDVRYGACESHQKAYCSGEDAPSGGISDCEFDTTGLFPGNHTWFAFACDSTTGECSNITETSGTNGKPFFVNYPPSAVSVNVEPPTPSTASDLLCYATLTDDFYSPITARVSWFKSGINQTALFQVSQLQNNTNSLASTVLSGNLSVGESWYCRVDPLDGFVEGANFSADPVFVADASPPIPTAVSSNVSTLEYGEAILLSSYWTDDAGLSANFLETNETGSILNYSSSELVLNPEWANYTWLNSSTYPDNTIRWRVWANDTSGNWAATGVQTFNVRDTTSPKYSDYGDNNSAPIVGETILLMAYWSENFNLSYAILETNETGTYQNKTMNYSSPMKINGTADWSNFTWRNASVQKDIQVSWRIWANDSKGNWNATPYKAFTVFSGVDLVPPKYYEVVDNSTGGEATFGQEVFLGARWQDNIGLGYGILETNESGTYRNQTAGDYGSPYYLSGVNTWSNFTWLNASSPIGMTIRWRVWANDSGDNWNATPYSTFRLVDNLEPSPLEQGTNKPNPDMGETIAIYSYWSDNYQLSSAKLETNESGTAANYSSMFFFGNPAWANFSWSNSVLPAGTEVVFRVWANDTEGNWNVTAPFSIILVDSSIPSVANQGINSSRGYLGDALLLSSQGYDLALDYAVLSTNESGSWFNYTLSYDPIHLGSSGIWTWSNFTWMNASFSGDLYWQVWYNDTSGNWNVTPALSLTIYDPSATSEKPSVSSCGTVYYRTLLFNSTDDPISADLTMRLLSPTLQIQTTQNIPDTSLPSGSYCGNFLLPYSPARGKWWLKATSSGVIGKRTFVSSTGNPNIWRIDLFLNSSTYYSSENLTANFTIYNLYGEGVPSLANEENMSVFINSTKILVGNVTDRGSGRYNITYPLSGFSPEGNYIEILANSSGGTTVSKREGFLVV